MISMKSVAMGYGKERVLKDVNLRVEKGEFVGVIGLSGAGKSTLLMSLIGNIDIFSGEYRVMDYDLGQLGRRDARELRSKVGFIFQGYNLVNRLSVFHNVMSGMLKDLPLTMACLKIYPSSYVEKAYEFMKIVGIDHLALKRCDELSGGQRQRVAIARALAQEPEIILADEPVAALDPKSAELVMDILRKINKKYHVTIVSNLHHIDFAKAFCSRILGVASRGICCDCVPAGLTDDVLGMVYQGTPFVDGREVGPLPGEAVVLPAIPITTVPENVAV